MRYTPAPRGLGPARQALAHDLRGRGLACDAQGLFLTASTSEAYSFVFKLYCDSEDEVLVPAPSYPLLEHLLEMECARSVPYRLVLSEEGWRIDFDSLEAALSVRSKVLVVINPNNPTGNCVHPEDRDRLIEICRREKLALVSDEVFLDYGFDGVDLSGHSLAGVGDIPTFVLGGLSKSLALPQLKLSWILASGPAAQMPECLDRLELIADTYLSVAVPVQEALPALLALAPNRQALIRARIEQNRRTLRELLGEEGALRLLPAQGGWYAVLKLAEGLDDESIAIELVREEGVLVQPGYFYDLDTPPSLVVSLLTPPADFRTGVGRVLARLQRLHRV